MTATSITVSRIAVSETPKTSDVLSRVDEQLYAGAAQSRRLRQKFRVVHFVVMKLLAAGDREGAVVAIDRVSELIQEHERVMAETRARGLLTDRESLDASAKAMLPCRHLS